MGVALMYKVGTIQWRISGDKEKARKELTGDALHWLHLAREAKHLGNFTWYDTGWKNFPNGNIRVISTPSVDTIYMDAVGARIKGKKYIVPLLWPAYKVEDKGNNDGVIIASWSDLKPLHFFTAGGIQDIYKDGSWKRIYDVEPEYETMPRFGDVSPIGGSTTQTSQDAYRAQAWGNMFCPRPVDLYPYYHLTDLGYSHDVYTTTYLYNEIDSPVADKRFEELCFVGGEARGGTIESSCPTTCDGYLDTRQNQTVFTTRKHLPIWTQHYSANGNGFSPRLYSPSGFYFAAYCSAIMDYQDNALTLQGSDPWWWHILIYKRDFVLTSVWNEAGYIAYSEGAWENDYSGSSTATILPGWDADCSQYGTCREKWISSSNLIFKNWWGDIYYKYTYNEIGVDEYTYPEPKEIRDKIGEFREYSKNDEVMLVEEVIETRLPNPDFNAYDKTGNFVGGDVDHCDIGDTAHYHYPAHDDWYQSIKYHMWTGDRNAEREYGLDPVYGKHTFIENDDGSLRSEPIYDYYAYQKDYESYTSENWMELVMLTKKAAKKFCGLEGIPDSKIMYVRKGACATIDE